MSFSRSSTVVQALVGCLALVAFAARPARAQRQIGVGRAVAGTLTTDDPILPSDRSHYKLFSFYGAAGQTVLIDLASGDFNVLLIFRDPTGQSIAEDTASAGARNARIIYGLPSNGMYMILAAARGPDQLGTFSLSVLPTRAPVVAAAPPAVTAPAPRQPAAQPAPQPVVVAPAPAPTPVPVDTAPKPTQPAPQPAAQPAPQPVVVAPAPAPTPVSVDTAPKPTQPAPQPAAQPAPQPVVVAQAPTPTQPKPQPVAQPVVVAPAPAPTPVPVDTAPAPTVPQPQPVAQPAPQLVAPAPSLPPVTVTPTNVIPAPAEVGEIAIGQTMRGMLSPGDVTMADGTYGDYWQFQGSAGQTVTIDVRSSAFGTYVQVFDTAGGRLGDDAGSGGGNDSRLVVVLKTSGAFQIAINNSEGRRLTGLYTLTLR